MSKKKRPGNVPLPGLLDDPTIAPQPADAQEPQPPPQPPDPMLQTEWSWPPAENLDNIFFDFLSLQYGQTVSSSLALMDCSSTKSLPQASHTYS
jgi:hypothetical protein